MMGMVELLAPAGAPDKLRAAVDFGADAVYAGLKEMSLRAAAENFTPQELAEGVGYAHARGARVYVTLNAMPREDEFAVLRGALDSVVEAGADAVIVSDPGVFALTREYAPGLPIHISTQMNTVNAAACRFWHDQGAERVVLARELSLKEISRIRAATDPSLELECFVHGAMCMSYSGRCLMSSVTTGRDANRGDCAQPCRWRYRLEEEKRPGEFFTVETGRDYSYVFNSKDLCLIRRLPELLRAGVTSFKIEGRNKSAFYVATVVAAYRAALDACLKSPDRYVVDPAWEQELHAVGHRPYWEGFLDGENAGGEVLGFAASIQDWQLSAVVTDCKDTAGRLKIRQRNKFTVGDTLSALIPRQKPLEFTVSGIYTEDGALRESAPHADETLLLDVPFDLPVGTMLRRRIL